VYASIRRFERPAAAGLQDSTGWAGHFRPATRHRAAAIRINRPASMHIDAQSHAKRAMPLDTGGDAIASWNPSAGRRAIPTQPRAGPIDDGQRTRRDGHAARIT